MGDKSNIEWTDATWNPVVGCSIVSAGCTHCYAMGQAARIQKMTGYFTHYSGTTKRVNGHEVWTGKVQQAPDHIWTAPLKWQKPRRIFVNSMGDLFHESVPDQWIDRAFAIMALSPQHTFQILTKRARRMRKYIERTVDCFHGNEELMDRRFGEHCIQASSDYYSDEWFRDNVSWPLSNVWLGVSAEDQARADERIPDLLSTPAAIRFVSAEPLLGPLQLAQYMHLHSMAWAASRYSGSDGIERDDLTGHPIDGVDWIIVGGESGADARPMHPDWGRAIRDQCASAGVPFFFKQWGEWAPSTPDEARGNPRSGWRCLAGHPHVAKAAELYPEAGAAFIERVGKKRAGRLLDGIAHNAMPEGK